MFHFNLIALLRVRSIAMFAVIFARVYYFSEHFVFVYKQEPHTPM